MYSSLVTKKYFLQRTDSLVELMLVREFELIFALKPPCYKKESYSLFHYNKTFSVFFYSCRLEKNYLIKQKQTWSLFPEIIKLMIK